MTEKKSKLKLFADTCLLVAQASLVFWVTLFKRGFVYAWIPAMKLTFLYVESTSSTEHSLLRFLKRKVPASGSDRFFSFLLSTSWTLSLASWLLFIQRMGDMSRILFLGSTLFWAICFIIGSIYSQFKEDNGEQTLTWFRRSWIFALGLLLCLLLLFWYSLTQNIIGWMILPGLYFKTIQFYQKLEKRNVT